ncbi:MAG TPA: tetraacyldisaccharide 4'-kinase [Sphingobacteriaceae bacterium]|nr:tetraacyldisaccharide 4'-kinase [Sphingobacteriaceae bacterium]
MVYLKWLLLPFSVLYGLILRCRHHLYDRGWFGFEQKTIDLPLIVVGNLEVGGTGKTPMIEYLIRLLRGQYRLATLSRGYGRKSRGYLEVNANHSVQISGDEPLQFKKKFPDITVAVSEKRVPAVEKLRPDHDVILLDDAFQHRALKPGLGILLFSYDRVLKNPWLLPVGPYRDVFEARKRADLIVVTKCPDHLSDPHTLAVQQRLQVKTKNIPIYFTRIAYGTLCSLWKDTTPIPQWETHHVLLVTGIARPQPLLEYVQKQAQDVRHLAFPDHHSFTSTDIQQMTSEFARLSGEFKFILTTEKDAMRIQSLPAPILDTLRDLPMYYLPIEQQFLDVKQRENFNKQILAYIQGV